MANNISQNPEIDIALNELEVTRITIAKKKTKGYVLVGVAVLTTIILTSFGLGTYAFVIGGLAAIPGVFMLVTIGDLEKGYKTQFKQEVIAAALSHVDQSLTIKHTEGIYEEEFIQSELFERNPDRYRTEDLVTGKADKTSFYFAEVHAEYKTETKTDKGREVNWHDILSGIVFCADFNKNFNGVTVVKPKYGSVRVGGWFSEKSFYDQDCVVELEDVVFSKNFTTYGSDQVEARYILTPALMDRICELNKNCAQTISLSFINSRVYIAFPLAKNYFEPPIFKTLLSPDLLNEDLSILQFMYNIVKELDLNTRIWTKQ